MILLVTFLCIIYISIGFNLNNDEIKNYENDLNGLNIKTVESIDIHSLQGRWYQIYASKDVKNKEAYCITMDYYNIQSTEEYEKSFQLIYSFKYVNYTNKLNLHLIQ